MKLFPHFFIGMLLWICMAAFAHDPPSSRENVCLDRGIAAIPMKIEGKTVGKFNINPDCLDKSELNSNPNKRLAGSVSVILCIPDFEPCSPDDAPRGSGYLTVVIPNFESVTKRANWYRERGTPTKPVSGLEVYTDEPPERKMYISTTKKKFNVLCLEGVRDCEMIGLISGKVEYLLQIPKNTDADSYSDIDLKVRDFIKNRIEIE